ncbi:MAG: TIGR03936 family radical SAM-associated protein [Treponema sp.]|nr:TIGR03936 family radical SAM-associated protein [Treponema sp.]
MTHIDPLVVFGSKLNTVNHPARYLGGEYGICVKSDEETRLTFAIAFPDLYEIAMSNSAVKIIYSGLNALSGVRCERVFAPDTDFEALLKAENVPLYTLESGIPLDETDVIGFSLGYELGLTGVFQILEAGRVPILKSERNEQSPLVIAGGCGVTNPMPFVDFFDAIFIGEAEAGLFELTKQLARAKESGAGRGRLLELLASHPSIWVEGKKAARAVWAAFGAEPSVPAFLPQPNIKPVQDHGVVEIMRGCPNGCRFCHAGIFYRPLRVKPIPQILEETDALAGQGGYTEISLTSLSSGDYPGIEALLDALDEKYAGRNISFQLPSLKVNSVTFPVLEKISRVRKSGLTFAVETPEEAWQMALNKEVYAAHLVELIMEAKRKGWSGAKFYFMIGLPVAKLPEGKTEEESIVDFMRSIQGKTRIQCSVTVGLFVPKPHTPYERCAQLLPDEAAAKFNYIRDRLPRGRFKVSASGGFTALLEGLVSRGGREAGRLFLEAFHRGCRLDAWDDRMREHLPIWQSILEETAWDWRPVLAEKTADEPLPWDTVSLGVSKAFLQREWECSLQGRLTPRCSPDCAAPCGVCSKTVKVSDIEQNYIQSNIQPHDINKNIPEKQSDDVYKIIPKMNIPVLWRCVFSFSKKNGGEFIPHLAMRELFQKAFNRSGIPVLYTAGFNPIPRLEFTGNLPIGIVSGDEIGSCVIDINYAEERFVTQMNESLPKGLQINKVFIFPVSNKRKRESLASSLWGSEYEARFYESPNEDVTAKLKEITHSFEQLDEQTYRVVMAFQSEKPFRDLLTVLCNKPYYLSAGLLKKKTLAILPDGCMGTYFDLYRIIAEINQDLM